MIYKYVLEIIKEMYINGIVYFDNHSKNYMIDPLDKDLKVNIVDFEYSYIKFDDDSIYYKKKLFSNYAKMVNRLNKIQGLDTVTGK